MTARAAFSPGEWEIVPEGPSTAGTALPKNSKVARNHRRRCQGAHWESYRNRE
jgi:hypothetical protein